MYELVYKTGCIYSNFRKENFKIIQGFSPGTLLQCRWAYKRDGGGGGGLISRIIYSFENGWAYIRGRLKPGGGLKVGFYGTVYDKYSKNIRSMISNLPTDCWPLSHISPCSSW